MSASPEARREAAERVRAILAKSAGVPVSALRDDTVLNGLTVLFIVSLVVAALEAGVQAGREVAP